MRRVLLMILLVVPLVSFSQNREFDKLIREYDVFEHVKHIETGKPALFWDAVWRNNERLMKLYEACDKKKSSAVEAQRQINEASLRSAVYYDNLVLVDSLQYIADALLEKLGIKSVYPAVAMYIEDDETYNARTIPDGRIFINVPFVMSSTSSYEIAMGICAHEIAHLLLQHSLEHAYSIEKKRKKNKIVAGVVSAVDVAANAYAQANGAVGEESWEDVEGRIEDLFLEAETNTNRFRYKYSREQEIEADIIAYRFLEYMGIGGINYIEGLKIVGYDSDKYYNDESDHPTMRFRVGLLEYLAKSH